ncbi:efflux RND transporter periplasmic adaptor subunit [Lutibacter sp. B1]|uniref:efflux RND transporter periplasmic adaptor subunit n=1 Tax=Lutibacter sp. B1 TaxID=2725996 RepID=UPI001456A208|nr:efflux RND transporter periplasmic adaptor subunit [Lutibacter sp. B1]NLP59010.1 efflux RND transporter periplasmic adaptor subunit [Lutibacter sp. B1]
MKNTLKISAILLLLIVFGSCQDKTTRNNEHNENNEGNNEEESGEHEEEASTLTLQLEQLEVMKIELGVVKQVDLGTSFKVNGQLEVPPQNMASVSAIVGGRVQSVGVIEGDYVKKGQVIAQLNNPKFITMQREYLIDKSNISYLEKDYKRKEALLKEGIVSSKSFQEVEAAYNEGKSALNASKSTLQLIGINVSELENNQIISSIPVIAPINGYVQSIAINIGKFVSPEQEMFEIVDNDHLHLGLKVFEKDIDKAKVGQKITFSLTTTPDKIYEAEIFNVGKVLDMNTRSVKVHADIIEKRHEFLAGMFVDARIVTSNKIVNALSDEAFISEKGLDYVFVQKEKTDENIEFEKIQVNRGISDLGFSEVLFIEEISPTTIIVIKGAYYLNSEMQKGEFGDDD